MATAQRVFYETITVLVFLVLLVAAWFVSGYRADRRLAAAREELAAELASRGEEHRETLRRMEEESRAALAARRRAEAEAVFRGYAAGLQPAAVAGWRRYLGSSRDELTRSDPAVVFVHLVTPAGRVLTSTDADLVSRGRLDESADWVLAAEELTLRAGSGSTLEAAGPILNAGRPVAYLWLGYSADGAADAASAGDQPPADQ